MAGGAATADTGARGEAGRLLRWLPVVLVGGIK